MPFIANADGNNCVLEAAVDVVVEVWDQDDEGNKGQGIWKGLIKQGETKSIQSRHGQIRYAQTTVLGENGPLSGDIELGCENGQTIGVP